MLGAFTLASFATMLVLIVVASGCGTIFAPKWEKPPPPRTSAEAWHLTKMTYQGALGLMTEWARTVEQSGSATAYEREIIQQAADVHRKAIVVIEEGDALTTGDYTDVMVRLNKLIIAMQQKYATRLGASPITPSQPVPPPSTGGTP